MKLDSNAGVVAIIPARGGSKAIPKKNLVSFCGKPLIAWTIEQCLQSSKIHSVWVTSDSDEILEVSAKYGARAIKRPESLSTDTSTSESAWIHAIDTIQDQGIDVSAVLALQATSPIRETKDIDGAIDRFFSDKLDSLFSASKLDDFFIWERTQDGKLSSMNYDYLNRKRRQDLPTEQFVENGSFYLFTPELIKSQNNRMGGKIGLQSMEFWKCFEINTFDDLKLCEAVMSAYLV